MDVLADNFVYGHMLQHTLLLEEASLLLALGLTGPVLGPILTKPGLRRLRKLTYPVLAVAIWLVVMYGWHAPPLYQAAEESEVIHLGEHACFVAAGVLMWLALLGPFPKPEWFGNGAKAIYAGAVHFSSMGLANILMWSGTVLYPFYAASDRAHGLNPITDQSLAGVVLMIRRPVDVRCTRLAGAAMGQTGRRTPGASRPRLRAWDRPRRAPRGAGGRRRAGRRTSAATRGEPMSGPARGRPDLSLGLLAVLLGSLIVSGCGSSSGEATAASFPGGDAVPSRPARRSTSTTTAAGRSIWRG